MANRVAERLSDLGDRARERRMESRIDKIDRENERLKSEVQVLREDLAEERTALQRALDAFSKRDTVTIKKPRRFRLVRTAVIGGGAYLLGTRAGRERYDQIMSRMRSAKDNVQGRIQSDSGTPWQPSASSTPTSPSVEGSSNLPRGSIGGSSS